MAREKSAAILEKELIMRLSLITGHGEDVVRDVIKCLSEFVLDEIANETPIRLGTLGELYTVSYLGRGGVSFKTKESLPKKMITKIKFKPSASMKRVLDTLNEQLSNE